ncbi:MAG: PAS domain-containing protein [Pseudomonadota bacterium]
MEESNQKLEEQVAERTRELEAANRDLRQEIEQHKKTQETLRQSEEKLSGILSAIADNISMIDQNYMVTWANKTALNVFGGDLVGKKCYAAFYREAVPCEGCLAVKVFSDGRIHEREVNIKLKDGSCKTFWCIASIAIRDKSGKPTHVIEACRDITEKRLAEKEATESRQLLKRTFDSLIDAVFVLDNDNPPHILDCNNAACAMFNYNREEFLGKTTLPLHIDTDHIIRFRKALLEEIKISRRFELKEFNMKRRDGSIFPTSHSITPLEDASGVWAGWVSVVSDISEQKKQESEAERLAAAISNTMDIVILTDQHGRIEYVNPSFQNITDYKPDEIIGKNIDILESGTYPPKYIQNVWDTISSGKPWKGRLANKTKNNRILEVESIISPVKDKTGIITGYVAIERDITKEIELERHIRHTQKMEAIGVMAGGIAHDLNNILSPVILNSEILLQRLSGQDDLLEEVNEILIASDRARNLVRQILVFSRSNAHEERRRVKIRQIVRETLKFLQTSLPRTISIHEDYHSTETEVFANQVELQQIIMNLCINSFHAMREKGGSLKLGLYEKQYNTGDNTPALDMNPGKYTRLEVSDTGSGILPEIIDRIFEPFFTTKPKNEGTGLGLSVVHGIVKGYGGAITVESIPDKGTTFNVYLPIAKTSDIAIEKPIKPMPLPTGSGRILLVDDEPSITRALKELLSLLGYSVTTKNSGAEALEEILRRPLDFDLVISDLTMPDMTGLELARKLDGISPPLPLILITGYGDTKTSSKAREIPSIKAIVAKPILSHELAKTIKQTLNKKHG